MERSLRGKVLVMSGGSRGIGLAIALRAARDGAGVAIIAKTEEPHPKLEGTIYSAAEAIRAAGGQALPIAGDVRDDDRVQAAIDQVVDHFGAIDICVNNASAIDLSPVESITMKRYDLMQDVNTGGTFVLTRACSILRNGGDGIQVQLSTRMGLNYGLHRVRFITPARVGKRIRAHARLLGVDEIAPNVFQQVNEITVEIEGESKPAMVAESITRLYL